MARRATPFVPGLKRSRWTKFKAAVAKRLGWVWQPGLYAGLVLGYLLGRALPGTQIAPFGLAFFAAVRGASVAPARALPVGVAVAAGAAAVLTRSEAFWVAVAVLFCHYASSVLRVGTKHPAPVGAAVIAALAAVIPAVMSTNQTTVQMIFWCGLSGILGLLFTLGIADAFTGGMFRANTTESPVPAIVIVATALCGLQGWEPWPAVSLRDVAAGVLVMASAYFGGAPLGAAAAAVLGISFLFTVLSDQAGTGGILASAALFMTEARGMAYVVAGLLAGTFRDLGRVGVTVAFCLGLITFLSIQSVPDLPMVAYSAAAATAVFWVLPAAWLNRLPVVFVSPQPASQEPADRNSIAGYLLDRIKGTSRVLREVHRTFEQVAAVQAAPEAGPHTAFEQVAERVCRTCSLRTQCWETEAERTYKLYSELWSAMEETGTLPVQPPPERLEEHCIRPGEVATTFNYLYDLYHSRRVWTRKLDEGRAVAGDYVKNVARVLERLVDEADSSDQHRSDTIPMLRIESGVAKLPKRGGHISGDSYAAAPLGPTRYLMALSDGMGVGREAALESKQCVNLLQKMLEAGFSIDVAVNTVNSVLLLRSPDETFATVDLAVTDLTTGRVEFVKIGAAPSFLKRKGDIMVIKSASVPVGIINQVQVESEYRILRPGDLIVMVTDGIWDLAKDQIDKEQWIRDHLAREVSTDPAEIAESLLARTLELMPDIGDDMTVLVARVDHVRGARAAEDVEKPKHGGWAPAKKAPGAKVTGPSRQQ